MHVAVPTFGSRVAPRFLHSDTLLLARVVSGKRVSLETLATEGLTEDERIDLLEANGASVLVCGGIGRELAEELRERGIEVIDNVAGEAEDVIDRMARGELRAGYGITYRPSDTEQRAVQKGEDGPAENDRFESAGGPGGRRLRVDCVTCKHRECLTGSICPSYADTPPSEAIAGPLQETIEVTKDIASEPERILCRVAELVYFCLGMRYKHVGLAFCTDLFTEAETIAHVMSRFLRVSSVCCKVGALSEDREESPDDSRDQRCNAFEMARVLNEARTDLNVIIGLCMGTDVVFTELSRAPVTTLFVKDRLLANNPVAAVHSHYVLDHILSRT